MIQSCVDALNECQIESYKMLIHVAVTDHTQPKVFHARQSSIPIIIIVLSTLDLKTRLMIVSQWRHDLPEWQTDWTKMKGCEEQLARRMEMHQWITPNSIMGYPKDDQWWRRNWFCAMRLGLCSNRTCWALSIFYAPCAVQNWIFGWELCVLDTLDFGDSEIQCSQ